MALNLVPAPVGFYNDIVDHLGQILNLVVFLLLYPPALWNAGHMSQSSNPYCPSLFLNLPLSARKTRLKLVGKSLWK